TMADMNINAPAGQAPAMAPPVQTDDQILPRIKWVPIGKSNCYLDLEKSQSNPIYKIAVDLLKHTNFFRAFTTSSTIPSIYIQQEALQVTPVNNNQSFVTPPSSDALINFVNELGYPKLVRNLSNVVSNDMFQPWRALRTIINLCLTGKTFGFERPRAPMLQILWGNMTRHTSGKKKATLIVIPSIQFTKLIIHHLRKRHRFHPRPDSPLHLPNEEPVLGYLKFSTKGTKREVFGSPIPGSLITADIQVASYYQEYLVKVAQHRRYLAGETGSNPDSPAPKPTKPARNPKSTVPKAPPRTSVSTPITSTQPAPTSALAKPQEKKCKHTIESYALEESMKSMYDVPRGPLPLVVTKEPESGKYQPLPEERDSSPTHNLHKTISLTLADLQMDEDMAPDEQAQSSDDEDIGSAHIPKVNLRQDWWKPLEEERTATPEPAWSIPSSDVPVAMNNWASALESNYSPPPEDSLLAQTGDIATFMDCKGSRLALSISNMKAAYYPNVGLEQMVSDQFWIKEECKYDIAAIAVRTHMGILSVVRIKVFSMYGYEYMKKIVLRRADLTEHVIEERDFKCMYPSDFEDLYLLNHQGHLNYLPPKDKKILTTAVN
nr:hypothetical protein [Tanacetum cinerariifolium]